MIVLQGWLESLEVFHFKNFKNFLAKFLLNYYCSTKTFLKYFSFFFIIDFGLFFLSSINCTRILSFFNDPVQNFSYCALFFYSLMSLSWFILKATYLLAIRLGHKKPSWHYFKINFIRYFKLVLLFSIVIIFFFNLMLFAGVYNFPTLHWTFKLIIRSIELLTVFYWLDSRFNLKGIVVSIEKAVNFLFYNFPFFIFIVILGLFFNFFIKFGFELFNSTFKVDATLGTWRQIQLLLESVDRFEPFLYLKLLILKYLKFFVNHFILTFIFTFYSMRKNKSYADSFFELED
ncbi:MAG: hypothetical protein ABIF12_01200 [bacterium]